jgi:hypothetical protein
MGKARLIFWSVLAGTVVAASIFTFSFVFPPVAPPLHANASVHFTPATTPVVANADEAASEPCDWRIVRDAAPKWMTVPLGDAKVDIPYSESWRVENPACHWSDATYDGALFQVFPQRDSAGAVVGYAMSFGRPADNLTYFVHEYSLSRRLTPEADIRPDEWSCGRTDIETPVEVSIGGVRAWKYFIGGAKWCAMVVQFTKGDHLYVVQRDLEPGIATFDPDVKDHDALRAVMVDIDPEMRRIIESIRD